MTQARVESPEQAADAAAGAPVDLGGDADEHVPRLALLPRPRQQAREVERRAGVLRGEIARRTQQGDRLGAAAAAAHPRAALEEGLSGTLRLPAMQLELGDGSPGLVASRQALRGLAVDRQRLIGAAGLEVRPSGVLERPPGVEVLPGAGEQRRDAPVEIGVARLGGQDATVEGDRPAPLAAGARPLGVLEDPRAIIDLASRGEPHGCWPAPFSSFVR